MGKLLGILGYYIGIVVLVVSTIVLSVLVDLWVLQPLGWEKIPFLRFIMTMLLLGVIGWALDKYIPDDENG